MNSQNAASPSKPRTSSSTIASASVRPRTKRYISGLEEFAETTTSTNNGSTASFFESPLDSRSASPIPSKHPSRSSSLRPPPNRSGVSGTGPTLSPTSDLAASLSGIWGKSWTSLQGLASNVLGNDLTDPIKDNPNAPRKPRVSANSRRHPATYTWGPPPEHNQPGAGSTEERKAIVRAKQRQDMLMQAGRGDLDSSNPAVQYKRRTSDEFESASAPPGNHDNRDALVYIHPVSPEDTLPGVSIKFNCPMTTIKKSNGMWSNDGIQARKNLIIPVDACNVKGKRILQPDSGDSNKTPTQESREWDIDLRRASTSTIKASTTNSTTAEDPKVPADENPWTHESWIMIEGHAHAIEIARLPRQNLGFFPRARRKSNAQSDLDTTNTTPSASLDQPRPSLTESDISSSAPGLNHTHRRSSGSQDFVRQMMGPGGVGTLKGKGPSAPGPAEDKLNKVFGKPLHLPSVDAHPHSSSSAEQVPPGVVLENVGSAIQGWVNKLAKGASKALELPPLPPTPANNHARQHHHHHRPARLQIPTVHDVKATSTGDLIELASAFEIGDDDEDELRDGYVRGRDRTPTSGRRQGSDLPQMPRIERPESERRAY